MKVSKTLVIGLGILLGCGCNRPTKTHYSNMPATTYGTYMGQPQHTTYGTYMGKTQPQVQKPGQSYYTNYYNH